MVTDVKSLKKYIMAIIKFKKEHQSGIPKGAVRDVDQKLSNRLIEEGFAEESTQEELEAYREELSALKKPNLHKVAVEEANLSTNECEECGDNPECEDCKDKKDAVEVKYHVLSEEDIDANSEAAVDCVVGDEVEENEAGELLVGEDGKFIKKDLGNV